MKPQYDRWTDEKKAKAFGKAHGYFGWAGGWIYKEEDVVPVRGPRGGVLSRQGHRPVCQGWDTFYHTFKASIDRWIEQQKAKKTMTRERPQRTPAKTTGPCFMCKNEADPAIADDPNDGDLATGSRIDFRDTYFGGEHAGEYRKIVFRGYVCDMHANGDDIVSIRYL